MEATSRQPIDENNNMNDRTLTENEIYKKIDSRIYESHSGLAKSISGFGADLKKGLSEINNHTNKLEVMQYKIDSNNEISKVGLNDINKKIDIGFKDVNEKLENFVTKDQFWPVKTIVYGCLGIILTSVVIAGVTLIINSNSTNTHASQQTTK